MLLQLIGCGNSANEVSTSSVQSDHQSGDADRSAKFIQIAKLLVVERLKDGDSAKFRNLRQFPQFIRLKNGLRFNASHRIVCGELNSKNSYGGYVGFSRFIVDVTTSDNTSDNVTFLDSVDTNLKKMDDKLNEKLCQSFETVEK